ncbi:MULTISPECIES: O-antigen polymerase [Clostridium]|uniref:O-antigen polymerase n=1 Tax=Clostridium frigoriphilum TaxID=443253 RepID=A0ABU7USC4_9CLOT|nr:O-antigen polymerase [Clostridium sp. DSM 17811]MBU3101555.1 oligosaccharide repeat unit polymerase [Clostridium sp. DSM 17811]
MINPFYVSITSFIVVILTFSLKWSGYYNNLDAKLYLFILLINLFNLIMGHIFKGEFKFEKKIKRNNRINKIIIFIYVAYLINYIYAGQIPIINGLFGVGISYRYLKMIPTFYPLLMSINTFYIIYVFYQYISFKDKKDFKYIIVLLIPLLFSMGRGGFVVIALSCVLLYCSSKKIKFKIKNLITLMIVLSISLYAFGYVGNLRNQSEFQSKTEKSNEILNSGSATEKFRKSIIPNEYFWTYIYVASPIANLNNIINNQFAGGNLREFIVYNFFPQSMQKKLIDMDKIVMYRGMYLINYTFNVSTAYSISYIEFGWMGILGYLIIYWLMFLIGFLIVRGSQYKTIFLCLYSTVGVLSLFDNMIMLDGIAIPIMLCLIFSLINRRRNRSIKYSNI